MTEVGGRKTSGIVLANFYFWYFAFIGVFGTYFALYLQSLGFAAAQIALLMSLQQFVRIVSPFMWGWIADHLHRRVPVIRATLVLALLSFSMLLLFRAWVPMLVVFVLMFTFWSAALPLFEAIVIGAAEGDAGRYARIRLWGSVGFIVAVLLAGSLLDHFDIGILLWGIIALLVAAVVSSFLFNDKVSAAASQTPAESLLPILRQPPVLALFAACFLMMASQSATFIFYSIYMVDSGHSKSAVGILWSMGVIAEICIFLTLPKINAHFTPLQLFTFSYVVTVLRYLLVGWFPELFAVQAVAQTMHAFTFGTWHAAAMAMLHRLFPGRLATRGQALYTSFSFGLGGAIGGVGAGLVWESAGPAWTFTIMAAIALAGGWVSWRYMRSMVNVSAER